uniref:Small ribosomal subunit protein uS17c n=1 Tax=Melanthalia intermedia TaxID=172989 RepID=A0A345UAV7_9FLOR|nr:ribosomal protein S17 [Melanthalia intermedia]AXI97593.1 ribosomal protein S17 [Melanthalia intermedia]
MCKKQTIGTVVSNRMNKTIVVAVKNKITHKKYKKIVTRTNKYYAHDELNICKIGDAVRIESHRPLSKKKHWILIEKILQK